jgi:DNA-directed RNA polymerase subunit E'/Rpb7
MTDNIYFTSIIKKSIIIEPKKQNTQLHDTIHQLVKQEFEGKCIEEGFVKPGSTHITKRSLLKTVPNNFGANMYVDVRIKADICRPVKGNVIECTVEKINKMGLMAIAGPLSIVVPRNFHSNKDAFKDIDIKSVIQIEVIGARYEINWDHIDVIAKLYDNQKHKKKKMSTTDTIKIIETDEPDVDVLETLSEGGEEEEVDDVVEDDADADDIDEIIDEEQVGGGDEEDGDEEDEKEIILDEEVVDEEGNMLGGVTSDTKVLELESDEEEEEDISELTEDGDDGSGGDVDDGDYGDDEI